MTKIKHNTKNKACGGKPKTSEAQLRACQKYDWNNTTRFSLKLNYNTNKAIIERLDDAKARRGFSKQGYVKHLIEEDIERYGDSYTNFAKLIDNASVDEVALLLSHNKLESGCLHCAENPDKCNQECFSGIRAWLLQEAEK